MQSSGWTISPTPLIVMSSVRLIVRHELQLGVSMNPQARSFWLYGASSGSGMSSAVQWASKYGSTIVGISPNPPVPRLEEGAAVPFRTNCRASLPRV